MGSIVDRKLSLGTWNVRGTFQRETLKDLNNECKKEIKQKRNDILELGIFSLKTREKIR